MLLPVVNTGVEVVGTAEDGEWLTAYVNMPEGARLLGSDFVVTDREYEAGVASCDTCGMNLGVGRIVRRYSVKRADGVNVYVNMEAHTCPRCGASMPLRVLPLPSAAA